MTIFAAVLIGYAVAATHAIEELRAIGNQAHNGYWAKLAVDAALRVTEDV